MESLLMFRLIFCSILLAGFAFAQWEVDGPNARLAIGGRSAAAVSPSAHQLQVIFDDDLVIDIESGQQTAGAILALSNVAPSGAAITTVPGLGIVNLGAPSTPVPSGVSLMGDGIGHTVNPIVDPFYVTNPGFGFERRLRLRFGLSAATLGLRGAFQAVVADPTMPPFSLDMTQCADVTVVAGSAQTILTGANGSVHVPFAGGRTFPFHGTSYTGVWIHADGFVTFGAPSTTTVGPGVDTLAFVSGPPAIAAWIGDFDITRGGPSDGVRYIETNDRARIIWGSPDAMPSLAHGISHTAVTDANRFSIELGFGNAPSGGDLGPGEFLVAFEEILEGLQPSPRSGIIGHTPGSSAALASAVDRDLHHPDSAPAATAMIEEHVSTSDVSRLGFDGLGAPRSLSDVQTWRNQSIRFTPTAGTPIGSAGYSSTSSGPMPSAYQPSPSPILPVVGGSTITLTGKFSGFDTTTSVGSIIVDPASLAIPVQVLGVGDTTGTLPRSLPHLPTLLPWRDKEGLTVRTPAVPAPGAYSVRIQFANGLVATDVWTFGNVSATTDVYLAANSSAQYTTALYTVGYLGALFTTFSVTSDGRICFSPVPCPTGLTPSLLNLFTPGPTGPLNTVAVLWTQTSTPPRRPIQVTIVEDRVTPIVTVTWNNCRWASSGTPVGTFSLLLDGLSDVLLDLTAVLPEVGGSSTAIIGFSDQAGGPALTPLISGTLVPPGTSMAQTVTTSTLLSQQLYSTVPGLLNPFTSGVAGTWILL